MERLIEICKLAIDNNDLQLALLLLAQNAVTGKLAHMMGSDSNNFLNTHDAMLKMIIVRYPEIYLTCHEFNTPLMFTTDMERRTNAYDNN